MQYFLFPTPFVICVLGIFDPLEYAIIDTVRKLARRVLAVHQESCNPYCGKMYYAYSHNSFISPGLHFVSPFASKLWTNQTSIVLHK